MIKGSDNKYELMVVLAEDKKEELAKIIDKITKTINDSGGKVDKSNQWAQRELAYPIADITRGVYYMFEMSIPSAKLNSLETVLKNEDFILRHLIIKV